MASLASSTARSRFVHVTCSAITTAAARGRVPQGRRTGCDPFAPRPHHRRHRLSCTAISPFDAQIFCFARQPQQRRPHACDIATCPCRSQTLSKSSCVVVNHARLVAGRAGRCHPSAAASEPSTTRGQSRLRHRKCRQLGAARGLDHSCARTYYASGPARSALRHSTNIGAGNLSSSLRTAPFRDPTVPSARAAQRWHPESGANCPLARASAFGKGDTGGRPSDARTGCGAKSNALSKGGQRKGAEGFRSGCTGVAAKLNASIVG